MEWTRQLTLEAIYGLPVGVNEQAKPYMLDTGAGTTFINNLTEPSSKVYNGSNRGTATNQDHQIDWPRSVPKGLTIKINLNIISKAYIAQCNAYSAMHHIYIVIYIDFTIDLCCCHNTSNIITYNYKCIHFNLHIDNIYHEY